MNAYVTPPEPLGVFEHSPRPGDRIVFSGDGCPCCGGTVPNGEYTVAQTPLGSAYLHATPIICPTTGKRVGIHNAHIRTVAMVTDCAATDTCPIGHLHTCAREPGHHGPHFGRGPNLEVDGFEPDTWRWSA